jgi:hypothetical protein
MSTKTPATIEDLYKVEGKAELVNGEIVEMPPAGDDPGQAGFEIAIRLREYARQTGVSPYRTMSAFGCISRIGNPSARMRPITSAPAPACGSSKMPRFLPWKSGVNTITAQEQNGRCRRNASIIRSRHPGRLGRGLAERGCD